MHMRVPTTRNMSATLIDVVEFVPVEGSSVIGVEGVGRLVSIGTVDVVVVVDVVGAVEVANGATYHWA